MTELEKEIHLTITKEILRQSEPQLDTSEYEKLFDDMIQKASTNALMRDEYLLTSESISDIIDSYRERLEGMRRLVERIEHTPASELSSDDIRIAIKRFAQPEGGGFIN